MAARLSLDLPRSLKAGDEDLVTGDGVSPDRIILLAPAETSGARGTAALLAERGAGGDPERAARWLEERP